MKVPGFLKTKRGYASAIFIALAFAFGLALYAFRGVIWTPSSTSVSSDDQSAAEVWYRHPLSGLPLEGSLETLPQPFAVMIDHSADAWPQSGIEEAFLVIEAPVEGGIPRLEAFFSDEADVEKIGPIRSARPYFIDWANEVDALYVHVGGSNEALEKIARNGTFDLNEFSNGSSFWRATDRLAPHNAYSSTELMRAAVSRAKERGNAPELLYGRWAFKTPAEEVVQGPGVTVSFSAATSYIATWTHDPQTNTYTRTQGKTLFTTAEGTQISVQNVAVIVTDMEVVDAVGRRHVRTVGEGTAYVFQDGKMIEGTWKKPSATERLRFYGKDGEEVVMNAGKTWIEVVENDQHVAIVPAL